MQVRVNTSSLYLYGGSITMNFTVPVPNYQSNTPIASTFLSPVMLSNKRGDIRLSLATSTVQSVSSNVVKIVLSASEYNALVSKIMDPAFAYSSMTMTYGGNNSLALGAYCMLASTIHLVTDVFEICLMELRDVLGLFTTMHCHVSRVE